MSRPATLPHITAPVRLAPAERARIGDLIDWLLAVLDADSGDPDQQPSLGWSRTGATTRYDGHARFVDLDGER